MVPWPGRPFRADAGWRTGEERLQWRLAGLVRTFTDPPPLPCSGCYRLYNDEEGEMTIERTILLVVGVVVLASVLLGVTHSPNWLWLTGLMGAHLVQAVPSRRGEHRTSPGPTC